MKVVVCFYGYINLIINGYWCVVVSDYLYIFRIVGFYFDNFRVLANLDIGEVVYKIICCFWVEERLFGLYVSNGYINIFGVRFWFKLEV